MEDWREALMLVAGFDAESAEAQDFDCASLTGAALTLTVYPGISPAGFVAIAAPQDAIAERSQCVETRSEQISYRN